MPETPAAGKKTLFLGLDGVMHHRNPKVAGFLSCMPLLEKTLVGADIDIVVLSPWDFASDFGRLKAAFPQKLRERVVGRTVEHAGALHKRFKEIQTWLQAHPVADWRVLDSEPFDYPDPCVELIYCRPVLGMGTIQADLLRQWLQSPQSTAHQQSLKPAT
ncbi:MAG: HAD domain-containing protein [Betaproteobacteria bacterium]